MGRSFDLVSERQQRVGLEGKRFVGAHVWRYTTSMPHQPFAGCHVCSYSVLTGW